MKRFLIILIFIFHQTAEVYAQSRVASIPLKRHFEPSEYQAGIQNWDFDQDSLGVLYVANNYGLLEFDGRNWRQYDVPSSTKLRTIYIDDHDRIFAGAQGQIGYYSRGEFGLDFVSLLERLPPEEQGIDEVWDIVNMGSKVYFGTSSRLFELDGQDFKEIFPPHAFQKVLGLNDGLLLQLFGNGLFTFSKGEYKGLPGTELLKEEVISAIVKPDRLILVSLGGTIYQYANEKLIQVEHSLWTNETIVNEAIELSNGNLAIGTQNDGLFIVSSDLTLQAHYTRNQGLSDRTVHSIKEDQLENLWIGLNNGIDYLELSSPISVINEQIGLEGTGYAAINWNGKTYLGTNNGLFVQDEPWQSRYRFIEGSEGQVYNLSIVNDRLIVNQHKGAFELDKKDDMIPIRPEGSWIMKETSDGQTALLGTYFGIVSYEASNGWEEKARFEEFSESSRVIEFQNDSTIWMTHGYKGAYLLEFDRSFTRLKHSRRFGMGDGFPSNVLISVYRLQDNLVFTGERGIYQYDPADQQFVPNNFLQEWLGDAHVSNLTEGPNGDIYFVSTDEFGYLNKKSLGIYEKRTNALNRFHKSVNDDLTNISVLSETDILIGAKEGFIHFNPLKEYRTAKQLNVILNPVTISFVVDSTKSVNPGFLESQKLKRVTSMKFDFSAPHFTGYEDISYSYRLNGFDQNWSDWTLTGTKEYTNLSPGKYRFQVKAINTDGIESQPYSVSFTIIPRWYKSNVARTLYFLIGVGLMGLLVYVQDRRHRKKHVALHESKDLVIKEKEQQLNEVSVQSKQQIEHLKNEKLKSEIDHKNKELASATMHLLNKNQFMLDIRKRLDTMVSSDGPQKEDLRKILRTIDRSLSKDDSWDQFAFHFDQVHGDFLKKLSHDKKLTPQETKLAAYLRMNMSSKEIADLMNISVRGVELARYRLRKKLGLSRDQNLIEFLLEV